MAQIMFETFNVPGIHVSSTIPLALMASGRTEGAVVESGDGVTCVGVCANADILPYTMQRLELGGSDCTYYLKQFLLNNPSVRDVDYYARDIKEKLCYVAEDYKQNIASDTITKSYELPDGQVITTGSESFRCPEVLFQPSFLGMEYPGIHVLLQLHYESGQSIS